MNPGGVSQGYTNGCESYDDGGNTYGVVPFQVAIHGYEREVRGGDGCTWEPEKK